MDECEPLLLGAALSSAALALALFTRGGGVAPLWAGAYTRSNFSSA